MGWPYLNACFFAAEPFIPGYGFLKLRQRRGTAELLYSLSEVSALKAAPKTVVVGGCHLPRRLPGQKSTRTKVGRSGSQQGRDLPGVQLQLNCMESFGGCDEPTTLRSRSEPCREQNSFSVTALGTLCRSLEKTLKREPTS